MKIKFTKDSFLKPGTKFSGEYPKEWIVPVFSGKELHILEWSVADDGHLKIRLDNISGIVDKVKYVFAAHVELQKDNGDVIEIENPNESTISQVNASTIPDNEFVEAPKELVIIKGFAGKVDLNAPIVGGGSFTWAEATHGGTRLPKNADHTYTIVKAATQLQKYRDRIGKPFTITSWYRPQPWNRLAGGASQSTHLYGGGVDIKVEGMNGRQLAKIFSDHKGGLGIYKNIPHILHFDVRGYKARWGGA